MEPLDAGSTLGLGLAGMGVTVLSSRVPDAQSDPAA